MEPPLGENRPGKELGEFRKFISDYGESYLTDMLGSIDAAKLPVQVVRGRKLLLCAASRARGMEQLGPKGICLVHNVGVSKLFNEALESLDIYEC